MATRMIVDKAFAIGKEKSNEKAVKTVQRIFRGFKVRDHHMPLVLEAQRAKEELKLHISARIV